MVNSHGFTDHLSAQRSGRLPSYLKVDEAPGYEPEHTVLSCQISASPNKEFKVITLKILVQLHLAAPVVIGGNGKCV